MHETLRIVYVLRDTDLPNLHNPFQILAELIETTPQLRIQFVGRTLDHRRTMGILSIPCLQSYDKTPILSKKFHCLSAKTAKNPPN